SPSLQGSGIDLRQTGYTHGLAENDKTMESEYGEFGSTHLFKIISSDLNTEQGAVPLARVSKRPLVTFQLQLLRCPSEV
ncbi:MAG: hypothetical protein ACK58T_03430, partial [Phycisphaerae bacterium]